jgi:hypothetical protein
MAFPDPADADTKFGLVATNSTSWTLTWPTNCAAGDLVILAIAADGNPTFTTPGTWPIQARTVGPSNACVVEERLHLCDGTETGNFTMTLSATEQGSWRMFRIPAALWYGWNATDDWAGCVQTNNAMAATSVNPGGITTNPNNWDVEETLWMQFWSVDTSRTVSAYPVNCPNNRTADVSGGSTGATLISCSQDSAVASFLAGNCTISSSDDWAHVNVAIRPKASGPTTYFGATALPITFGKAVAATKKTFAQTATSIAFGSTTQGARKVFSQIAFPITFSKEVTGRLKLLGQVAVSFTFNKAVAATKKTFGQTATPLTIGIATAGIRAPLLLFGATAFPITFGKEVLGSRKTLGQIAAPFAFGKDVRAVRKTFGQLLSPYIFGESFAGFKKTFGQTATPLTFTIATAAIRPGITLFGALTFPITFVKDVNGRRKTFSQTALPLIFAKEVGGRRKTFSLILFPITFTKEAVGRKNVFGQLSAQTLFGKETAGQRKTFSQFVRPFTFVEVTAGRKQTFGQIAWPITIPIYVAGFGWTGAQTYFGSLSAQIAFNKQVAAQRKTFGQITAPYFLGEFIQGARKTFSNLQKTIVIDLEVVNVHIGAHGIVELDLILTTVTNGRIPVSGVILNDALALYLGDQALVAAYAGSEEVWRLA